MFMRGFGIRGFVFVARARRLFGVARMAGQRFGGMLAHTVLLQERIGTDGAVAWRCMSRKSAAVAVSGRCYLMRHHYGATSVMGKSPRLRDGLSDTIRQPRQLKHVGA